MNSFPIKEFDTMQTPFYYYDIDLLKKTLSELKRHSSIPGYSVHYAIKANANPIILNIIKNTGLGVDCVSGGEIKVALDAGFAPSNIVFAGVGKSDWEIELALENEISCFNVESEPELEVIQYLAAKRGVIAQIALRVNPNIDAHTHHYITTGLAENKFGINLDLLDGIIARAQLMPNIELIGLHFHIGSQITDNTPFRLLCERINTLQDNYESRGIKFKSINVGGGLGIDYKNPIDNPIPDFKEYFDVFKNNLKLRHGQELHFELGRSIVAQCGTLITRALYIKKGIEKKFAIVDAGMTELIRPALYQAHHYIENISNPDGNTDVYDVVGPICESSDCFGEAEKISEIRRGDIIAIRSAGAYGEIMASQYNCRTLPESMYR